MSGSQPHAKSTTQPKVGFFATLPNLFRAKGTSAPSPHRLRATLAALALAVTVLAASAAPASADTAKMVSVTDVSYGSAHLKGEVSIVFSNWQFEYSKNPATEGWTPGPGGFGFSPNEIVERDLTKLKGATKYFVRLTTSSGAVSPEPNPEFTTLAADPPTIPGAVEAGSIFSTSAAATAKVIRPGKSDDVECRFEYISDANFSLEQSEVQELSVSATGGSFQLEFEGQKTAQIAFDASAATVEAALNSLPIVGFTAGSIEVSGGPGDENASSPYLITFGLELANQDVALIRSDGDQLTGAVTAINVSTATPGHAVGFGGAKSVACAENPISAADADTEKAVTAQLGCTKPVFERLDGKCLKPDTTYHLQLVAESAGGVVSKGAASTFLTPTAVAKPAVLTSNDATDAGYFSAKVSGEVQRPPGDDPALDTSCGFEYVTDAEFGLTGFDTAAQTPCLEAPPEAPLASPDPGHPAVSAPVSAELTGLADNTTYHLRLSAENGGGATSKDAAGTFTTLDAIPPALEVDPVEPADVGYTSVHLHGELDRGTPERELSYGFQVSSDPDDWSAASIAICCTAQPGKQEASQDLEGLRPGATYYVRLAGYDYTDQSTGGSGFYIFSSGPYESFTTKGTADPPSAVLGPVSDITGTGAHFSGTVDTKAPPGPLSEEGKAAYRTTWTIECTPECKDAHGNVFGGTVEADEGSKAISADAKRLQPNTSYEVRLVAQNVLGAVESVQTFKTPVLPPTVKSTAGAPDGKGGYILEGVVDPNNSPVTGCEFKWGPTAPQYAFSVSCSPKPEDKRAVTVEAHLTGLSPGAVYHSLLVITYGEDDIEIAAEPQEFTPTQDAAESCANEQRRAENSSLALPECRAYEMVTPTGKRGYNATFVDFSDERLEFFSFAGNLANSGQGLIENYYVARRTAAGWETIPNLNGPSGSIYSAPTNATGGVFAISGFSADLLSSSWVADTGTGIGPQLRNPDGSFTQVGHGYALSYDQQRSQQVAASDDLSHLVFGQNENVTTTWGPGIYEFVGTGNPDPPRRVDVDNSGAPISTCVGGPGTAETNVLSGDGRVLVFTAYGASKNGGNRPCTGVDNPPFDQVWARLDGSVSVDVSGSQCHRSGLDPDGPCNAPAEAVFQGASADGSRVFFITKQQLLDSDTDEAADLYLCDIPAGVPSPSGEGNSCASLRRVPGLGPARATDVLATSEDGSTVYFAAEGVLAANPGADGQSADPDVRSLYVWRAASGGPEGATRFIGALDDHGTAQTTEDGRFLLLGTTTSLLDTDTDSAADLYRYDALGEGLVRVSTAITGVGGNGEGLGASITEATAHHPTTAISEDGEKIVFTTAEPLSPLDGNEAPDVYLWTPARVSLISTGSVEGSGSVAVIDASGRDIYFQSAGALTPADPDLSIDVYDARLGGGFSFAAQPCAVEAEACQSQPPPLPVPRDPGSGRPGGPESVPPPKKCPKGKVRRHGKCVKKKAKKGKGHKRGARK